MEHDRNDPPGEPPDGGWLPPEPPGGTPPGSGPPGSGPPSPPADPAWGAPPQGQPSYGQPSYGQPPYQGPSWQGPYAQQQPYGQGSPYQQPQYQWHQAEPDNSPAVAGFVLSITSLGTLILFFGFLSPINFCVSIAGIFVSRNGIRKVERGETTRNKDLAKWGFWLGIVGVVLSALVIIGLIALFASDPNWLDELDDSEPR